MFEQVTRADGTRRCIVPNSDDEQVDCLRDVDCCSRAGRLLESSGVCQLECEDPRFSGSLCRDCADNKFTGENCDMCRNPRFVGPNCDMCRAGFAR